MYSILVIGSRKNYFFSEVVNTFIKLGCDIIEYTDDINISNRKIDFIFCTNDIRPRLNEDTNKIPLITWIGERPTWTYFWHNLNERNADIIFVTEKRFINDIRLKCKNNNVFYLPLATSFNKNKVINSEFKYDITFIGNTMKKQIRDLEYADNALLKLPIDEYEIIKVKDLIGNEVKKKTNISLSEIESFALINELLQKTEKCKILKEFKNDLLKAYIGMLLTSEKRINILNTIAKKFDVEVFQEDWKNYFHGKVYCGCAYENVWKIYSNSKININITSMHMPSSYNSRIFDAPVSNGFLITDFREDIYELFEMDEIVCYQNDENLLELIEFYHKNEKSRNEIIKRATKRINNQHLYIHRVKMILDKFKMLCT